MCGRKLHETTRGRSTKRLTRIPTVRPRNPPCLVVKENVAIVPEPMDDSGPIKSAFF